MTYLFRVAVISVLCAVSAQGMIVITDAHMLSTNPAHPMALDEYGRAVGWIDDADATDSGRGVVPFSWDTESAAEPGASLEGAWAEATSIATDAYVCGWGFTEGVSKPVGFLSIPGGRRRVLRLVDSEFHRLQACNTRWQSAGMREVDGVLRAFRKDPDAPPIDLGSLDDSAHAWSWVTDMNDRGDVVGWALNGDGQTCAFLYTDDLGMIDLGHLGGEFSQAYAINNNGWVVGWSRTAELEYHAFLFTPAEGMIDLGQLAGENGGASQALGINDNGVVTGWSILETGQRRAFVRTRDGQMRSFSEPIRFGDRTVVIQSATDINNAGQLVLSGQVISENSNLAGRRALRIDLDITEMIEGDLNGDGTVNAADLVMILSMINIQDPRGDLNMDNVVNVADFHYFLGTWNQRRSETAP